MRPRERAIREQLKMIADICREAGVACLMNGDVTSRDEAMQLAQQYGCDGGMIATAAEKNPSVFRSKEEGGPLTWEEVTEEYVKTALEVENRWGNTKYLLGQMIPGKSPKYRQMTSCKSYSELVKVLDMSDELRDLAMAVDERLDIGHGQSRKETKAEKKARNKAAMVAAENVTAAPQITPQLSKRKAEEAGLDDMPPDMARQSGPGSVPEQASVLAV